MHIEKQTIRQAFEKHAQVYVARRKWSIDDHCECWVRAGNAFDKGSSEDFKWLYQHLKGNWQVFRGSHSQWTQDETYAHLCNLGSDRRHDRLSHLDIDSMLQCWNIIQTISPIKMNKSGPSVVALSKFLHFWNPRLFVIVDDAMMWRWVFAHQWIRQPMLVTRERIRAAVACDAKLAPGSACDLPSYLAILLWCADVIRANPVIVDCFAEYVRHQAGEAAKGLPLEDYEAAGMEWLLLGLVELLPPGVSG